MLKLKRVEIHGFKSFYDRTEMKFSGAGIAAVVGPNGCGKSNLSDAISWVLGEQSAKSLRGARMEDVIFAGTRDKKALGMASVTMTLVPDEAKLAAVLISQPVSEPAPAEQPAVTGEGHHHIQGQPNESSEAMKAVERTGEVTITRRLYRSGESEYLINGRTARLRDIQDLFLGTGLGPESYAIIEQGRIGQILSNKPQDRRSVIEEAAGITRFKTRKRLAEAKLESAKQNLARVFDILEEVTRQVNSLKRQAAKTKRYKELKEEATGFLRQVLAARFKMLERESARLAIELSTASSELETVKAGIVEREAQQMAVLERSYANEQNLTTARKTLADYNLDNERTRGKLDYQLRQIQQIDSRLTNGAQEGESLERQQLERAAELEQQAAGVEAVEIEFAAARELMDAKSAERQEVQSRLAEQERSLEAARQRVLRLLNEASALKNRITQVDAQLATADRDTGRAKTEEHQCAGDLERIQGIKKQLSERLTARQTELISVTDQRKEVESELQQKRGQLNESRQLVERLRGEFSRVKARRDSLDEIIQHRSYTTETVKRLFTAVDKGQTQDFKPVGVLADFLEVDPQFEKATEEFLHDELEFVVVRNWEDAERGVELMRGELNGRATFLAEHAGDASESPAELAMPTAPEGTLTRLTEALRFNNGLTELPSHWLPRIANCFIADDRGLARQLATQFPHCWFLTKDGINYHGRAVSGGKKSGAGPLALKRELREVIAIERTRQAELTTAQTQLADLEHSISHLSEHLEQLRSRQQSQEKEVLAMDHETRKLAEEFQRVNSRLSAARLELERIGRDRLKLEETVERDRITLEEREAARSQEEYGLESAREELSGLQSEVARAAEEHAGLRANLASLEERRRSLISIRGRLENQVRDFANRRAHLAAETARLTAEKTAFLESNGGLQTKAEELAKQIVEVESSVTSLAALEAEMRAKLAAAEDELRRLRTQAQAGQERRSELQVAMARAESDLKHLEETAAKELETTLAVLVEAVETIPDEAALCDIDTQYTEVRRKIDALGPVNPTALEEYEESAQRQEFLTAQRADLLDSIRDTEKAIHEIDGESRKRFSEAFHAINANFKKMFEVLFGGGTGEMRLTDEENLAESGIDIVAQPPGKRLQSVLLLSGGEKSMTAMALLMSIFQYTPSPFCILDEVDAPLDEPNIERLTHLLKEMSEQTQFIVITHAKRTMEVAQSLYGVTMQEPGVSRLVSVKFKAPVDGKVQRTRLTSQKQEESERLLEAVTA